MHDERHTPLPDLTIHETYLLVLIYYCAHGAELEEHVEKLLIHIREISYGLLLENKNMWHILSYTGISTFQ
jgi:hypothetical protein